MSVKFGYAIVYVSDVEASLEFYEHAFGFERQLLTEEGDYGELASGETVLGFAASDLAESNLGGAGGFSALQPEGPPPGIALTLLTDDVAGIVVAAESAGGRRYVDAIVKPWGQTVAYVLDPNGVLVEIATPMNPS